MRTQASGRDMARYRRSERCTYHCHERLACIDFTDGFWIWRAEYEHAVRRHVAPVPEAFIRTVLAGELPELPESESTDRDAFWRTWSSSHRNPAFLADFKHARLAAYADVERELAEQTAESEQRLGTGCGSCAYANCLRPALDGSALCARHVVLGHGSPEDWGWRHFSAGTLLQRWTEIGSRRS